MKNRTILKTPDPSEGRCTLPTLPSYWKSKYVKMFLDRRIESYEKTKLDKMNEMNSAPTDRLPMHHSRKRPRYRRVHDDFLSIKDRTAPFNFMEQFRIQIWQAKGAPAVVLVSGIEGFAPPHLHSEWIASSIFESPLKFPSDGMLYFERSLYSSGLHLVDFMRTRRSGQIMLCEPKYHPVTRSSLSELLGGIEI